MGGRAARRHRLDPRAAELRIEADPEAVPFYQRMGAKITGSAPSGSIPGRRLPLLRYTLR